MSWRKLPVLAVLSTLDAGRGRWTDPWAKLEAGGRAVRRCKSRWLQLAALTNGRGSGFGHARVIGLSTADSLESGRP